MALSEQRHSHGPCKELDKLAEALCVSGIPHSSLGRPLTVRVVSGM